MRRLYRGLIIAFFASLSVILLLSFLATFNDTFNVSAVEANGVGVYWDGNCANPVSSIEWGVLSPGLEKSILVYIRNEGQEPVYLVMNTRNWKPSEASNYLTLGWNAEGQQVNTGEVLQRKLKLTVSRYIEGISSFSFEILVSGSLEPPGDINGDGKIDLADLGKMQLIYSGIVTEPAWMIENADLNGNGQIDVGDMGKMILIFSGTQSA